MELTSELVQKHIRRLVEASTTVKAHTSRSKKGKVFNVKQHQRELTGKEMAMLKYHARFEGLLATDLTLPQRRLTLKLIDKGVMASKYVKVPGSPYGKEHLYSLTGIGKKIAKAESRARKKRSSDKWQRHLLSRGGGSAERFATGLRSMTGKKVIHTRIKGG